MVATVFAGLVIGKSRGAEFTLLAGQTPIVDALEVRDATGKTTEIDSTYAFPGDFYHVESIANAQLLRAGWSRQHVQRIGKDRSPTIEYREPVGMRRMVIIDKDCDDPGGPGGLGETRSEQKGWVGVTVIRPCLELNWRQNARHLFFKIFRGDP